MNYLKKVGTWEGIVPGSVDIVSRNVQENTITIQYLVDVPFSSSKEAALLKLVETSWTQLQTSLATTCTVNLDLGTATPGPHELLLRREHHVAGAWVPVPSWSEVTIKDLALQINEDKTLGPDPATGKPGVLTSRGYEERLAGHYILDDGRWVTVDARGTSWPASEMRIVLYGGNNRPLGPNAQVQDGDNNAEVARKIRECRNGGGTTRVVERKQGITKIDIISHKLQNTLSYQYQWTVLSIHAKKGKYMSQKEAVIYSITKKNVVSAAGLQTRFQLHWDYATNCKRDDSKKFIWTVEVRPSRLSNAKVTIMYNRHDCSIIVAQGDGWSANELQRVDPALRAARYFAEKGPGYTNAQRTSNAIYQAIGHVMTLQTAIEGFVPTSGSESYLWYQLLHTPGFDYSREAMARGALGSRVHRVLADYCSAPATGTQVAFMAGQVNNVVDVTNPTGPLLTVNLGSGDPVLDTSPPGVAGVATGHGYEWVYYKIVTRGIPMTVRANWATGQTQLFLGHVHVYPLTNMPDFATITFGGRTTVVMNSHQPNADAYVAMGEGQCITPRDVAIVFETVESARDALAGVVPDVLDADNNEVPLARIEPGDTDIAMTQWTTATYDETTKMWSYTQDPPAPYMTATFSLVLAQQAVPAGWPAEYEFRARQAINQGIVHLDVKSIYHNNAWCDTGIEFASERYHAKAGTTALDSIGKFMEHLGEMLAGAHAWQQGPGLALGPLNVATDATGKVVAFDPATPWNGKYGTFPFLACLPVTPGGAPAFPGLTWPVYQQLTPVAFRDGLIGIVPSTSNAFASFLPVGEGARTTMAAGHTRASSETAGMALARLEAWTNALRFLHHAGREAPSGVTRIKAGITFTTYPALPASGTTGLQGVGVSLNFDENRLSVGGSIGIDVASPAAVDGVIARVDAFAQRFPAGDAPGCRDAAGDDPLRPSGNKRLPSGFASTIILANMPPGADGKHVQVGMRVVACHAWTSNSNAYQVLAYVQRTWTPGTVPGTGTFGAWTHVIDRDNKPVNYDKPQHYVFHGLNAFDALASDLASVAQGIADGDVGLDVRGTKASYKIWKSGTYILPLRVRLATQQGLAIEDCQLAWFETTVNEQTNKIRTMVKFAKYGESVILHDLASDMTCFPAVAIDKKKAGWENTPVTKPTFHDWIENTFGALPGFVKSKYFEPKFFIQYMRYMSGLDGYPDQLEVSPVQR